MSSSPPAPSSSPSSGRRSSPNGALAFLVHSPTTVANSLPPDVDNKPLARQKRRRTSKEDEDVLKAEYLKNPKPDKATRLDIVRRVALGEKEVQIWFQNKRQNDRRRSRPIEPSSTPSLMSSSSIMSDPPTEDETQARESEKDEEQPEQEETYQIEKADAPTHPANRADAAEEETDVAKPAEPDPPTTPTKPADQDLESQSTLDSGVVISTDPRTVDTAPTELSSSQHTLSSSQGASQSRTSWISNRRSASFVRNGEDYAPETITFPHSTQSTVEQSETRALKRVHSFVRISTNEDGTARVVTDLDKTPSPPHPKTNPGSFSRAAAGLRRSYSAAGLNDRLVAASREDRSPKLARTSSNIGRSRDSRAWEFWCDPDSRYNTSLTTRAEQEGSGSAADAIGVLRANRRILQQSQARQNAQILSRQKSAKMSGEHGVKKARGSMQRASTTYGRLQSKENKKRSESSESEEFPQTESDKENWEPGDAPQSRRPTASSQRSRKVLGENTEIMSQSSSLGNMMVRGTPNASTRKERNLSDPEQDEELRMFMNGGGLSRGTTVSSAEEAGCVEGLLKLSQGQWR